jgi:hypothetical protein
MPALNIRSPSAQRLLRRILLALAMIGPVLGLTRPAHGHPGAAGYLQQFSASDRAS